MLRSIHYSDKKWEHKSISNNFMQILLIGEILAGFNNDFYITNVMVFF